MPTEPQPRSTAKVLNMRLRTGAVALSLAGAAICGTHAFGSSAQPFEILRQAYVDADATTAASAYAEHAVYGELYPGAPPRLVVGRANITKHFVAMFASFSGGVDLNFRIVSGDPSRDGPVAGYYRLRMGPEEGAHYSYGSFVAVVRESRFTMDTSSSATQAEFDAAGGALLFSDAPAPTAPE